MMVDARRSRARDVGIVLVLALLAVDAVLVVMALRNPTEPPPVTVADTPLPTPTAEATEPVPTEAPTPTPTQTAEPVQATARELPLAVLDAERAVRSTSPGACGQPGTVEFTEDGGATWAQYEEAPELAVLRVRIRESDVWFVGADERCVADFARTEDGGSTWALSGRTSGVWHLLPDPLAAELHAAPDAVAPGPCADLLIVELESPANEDAYLLCADGTVHTSADGSEWTPVGNAPGAVAMGLRDGVPVVTVPGAEGCAGLAVLALEGDAPASIGCAEGVSADGVALAFAETGGAGFLIAGGNTWTTEDGGITWTSATV